MEVELVPIRARADELTASPARATEALQAGAERAGAIAKETMREVRDRMGVGA
jgi:tryptophanyl-tRNA synthetase